MVVITGKEKDIKLAGEELKSYLYGGNGIKVTKVFIPSEILGALIGKGGGNLKKLEKDYHPVKVNVMRITKRICRVMVHGIGCLLHLSETGSERNRLK